MANDRDLALWVLARVYNSDAMTAELVVLAHRCGVLHTRPTARMRELAVAWLDAPPAECRAELEEQYRRAVDAAADEVSHG